MLNMFDARTISILQAAVSGSKSAYVLYYSVGTHDRDNSCVHSSHVVTNRVVLDGGLSRELGALEDGMYGFRISAVYVRSYRGHS